ncbi:hypothetical protein Pan258_45690 [Symmachiella dynata]|uniref:hypothetical protein n=1 Tax=Symmachiella dynata TaxID=2527995 RepID=UPI00118A446F|nr:hypothetical protein [Symmachiella dynata]QDT50491.1 hypothetical protein Pan258_45690 [Symmachiella dynata]
MSVFYALQFLDEALVNEMTVFVDPLKTEPQYKPGLRGVAASLNKLEDAVFDAKWESICSVLGDMAMCLDIKCCDCPNGVYFDFAWLQSIFGDLEEAVNANDEASVRSILREMLLAADLFELWQEIDLES